MLLRCPLKRTKSPSSRAASRMREARSGLTGVPSLPLELGKGLVEGTGVQSGDDLADLPRLVRGGLDACLQTGVDLLEQLHGPVERPDQLLVGNATKSVDEPLELPDLLLELSEVRRLSTILHRLRTIHQRRGRIRPRSGRASWSWRAIYPMKVRTKLNTYFVTRSMALMRSLIISSEAPSCSARSSTKSFNSTVFIRRIAEKIAFVCWTRSA